MSKTLLKLSVESFSSIFAHYHKNTLLYTFFQLIKLQKSVKKSLRYVKITVTRKPFKHIYVTTQLQKSFFEKNEKHKFSKRKSELIKEIECIQCVRSFYFVIIYLYPLFLIIFGFFKNLFSSPLIFNVMF